MTRERRRGRLRRWLGYPLLAGVILLVLLLFLENAFIYHPSRDSVEVTAVSRAGFAPVDCRFRTEDGVELHAWYVEAAQPVGTLLYFHGNAGNLADRAPILEQLVAHGMSVLIFDYRGYGRSQDTAPSEEGLYRDGRAAWRYLTGERRVPPGRVVLFGNSLGGAVAIELAGEVDCAGLVLQSSFTSIAEMTRQVIPLVPLGWALRHKMRNIDKVRGLRLPKLVIHGERDRIVPFDHGRRLFEAAAEPKRFLPVPSADHNDLWLVGGAAYHEALREFVRSVASR